MSTRKPPNLASFAHSAHLLAAFLPVLVHHFRHYRIDVDFVLGQDLGRPVARVTAARAWAAVSSIDFALGVELYALGGAQMSYSGTGGQYSRRLPWLLTQANREFGLDNAGNDLV